MNHQDRWIEAVRCGDIPLREGRSVKIAGREIAVFNLGDRWAAMESRCPHKGGPLADGIVAGSAVVCPLHGWNIGFDAGKVVRPASGATKCVRTFPTRVERNIVFVQVPLGTMPAETAQVCAAEDETRFHSDRMRLPNQETAASDIGA